MGRLDMGWKRSLVAAFCAVSISLAGCGGSSGSGSNAGSGGSGGVARFGAVGLGAGGDSSGLPGDTGGPRGPVSPGQGGPVVFEPSVAGRLASISVTPSPATVAVGATVQLSLRGLLDDGTSVTIAPSDTVSISYVSDNTTHVTVSGTGLVTGVTAGAANVTATVVASGESFTTTVPVTVTATAPPTTGGPVIFVTQMGFAKVGVYDAQTYALVDEVEVGDRPLGMAYDPVRNRVVVPIDNGTVTAFDASTYELLPITGAVPGGVVIATAYDAVHDAMFIVSYNAGRLSALDAGSLQTLPNFPVAVSRPAEVAIEDTGARAFVTQNGPTAALLIVTVATQAVQTIQTQGGFADGLAYDAARDLVYVGNDTSGSISVINLNLSVPALVQTFASGQRPTGMAVDKVNDRLYATDIATNSLMVYDTAANPLNPPLLRTLPCGSRPISVTYDNQRNRILVCNESANTLSVYDAASFQLLATPAAGFSPYLVLVKP